MWKLNKRNQENTQIIDLNNKNQVFVNQISSPHGKIKVNMISNIVIPAPMEVSRKTKVSRNVKNNFIKTNIKNRKGPTYINSICNLKTRYPQEPKVKNMNVQTNSNYNQGSLIELLEIISKSSGLAVCFVSIYKLWLFASDNEEIMT